MVSYTIDQEVFSIIYPILRNDLDAEFKYTFWTIIGRVKKLFENSKNYICYKTITFIILSALNNYYNMDYIPQLVVIQYFEHKQQLRLKMYNIIKHHFVKLIKVINIIKQKFIAYYYRPPNIGYQKALAHFITCF